MGSYYNFDDMEFNSDPVIFKRIFSIMTGLMLTFIMYFNFDNISQFINNYFSQLFVIFGVIYIAYNIVYRNFAENKRLMYMKKSRKC